MYGDGHHSDLPEEPGMRALIGALAGELSGFFLGLLREELDSREERLVSLETLAAFAECSTKTVSRHLKRYGIPKRNIHGGIWAEGDGPVRYSLTEWKARGPLHTRSVTNELRQRA